MKRDYRRSGRGRKRSSLAPQPRQLGDVRRDPPWLVAGKLIAVRRGDYVGYRGECGSARLALETTWAVLARRAARGSTYRKATCGAAFRLRLSVTPFKVADPRISPL